MKFGKIQKSHYDNRLLYVVLKTNFKSLALDDLKKLEKRFTRSGASVEDALELIRFALSRGVNPVTGMRNKRWRAEMPV